jgi:hypothetical protein
LSFIDLTKAFDRVRLADVIECLREREVPEQIVRVIKELNTDTTAIIRSYNQTSGRIIMKNGIRQGDSLSPVLFNLIMDKIIANLLKELGYKMGNDSIHIICYADDAVLIADNEENLQTLLLRFDQLAERLNMEISLNKTKSLTISRNYTKCEVKLRGTMIEQVPKFNYLGAEISAKRDLKQEVRIQVMKAARISGCLYKLIWNNKYMTMDCKIRIYKTNVRPVLTYASETRAETVYTQQLLRTTEMKTIRAIHGKTLRDKIRSEQLRHVSGIQGVNKWTEVQRREWDGMWEEWRITVWQRLLEVTVHRECVAEADQRNDGKKVSSKPPPALTPGRTGVSL